MNPLCGDRIAIKGKIAAGRLLDARHHGDSCAICAASADLLLEMAVGRSVEEAVAVGVEAVLARLREAGARVSHLEVAEPELEEVFVKIMARGEAAAGAGT